MLLKQAWLLVLLLNGAGVAVFWTYADSSFGTRFDFHGNPTNFQSGGSFAGSMALLLFFFNALLLAIDHFAGKAGFAELTNIPNKAYWIQNGQLTDKLRELLSIQAIWINVLLLGIFAYTAQANLSEDPKLHPSFILFMVAMVMTLVISIYKRTRKGQINGPDKRTQVPKSKASQK